MCVAHSWTTKSPLDYGTEAWTFLRKGSTRDFCAIDFWFTSLHTILMQWPYIQEQEICQSFNILQMYRRFHPISLNDNHNTSVSRPLVRASQLLLYPRRSLSSGHTFSGAMESSTKAIAFCLQIGIWSSKTKEFYTSDSQLLDKTLTSACILWNCCMPTC